MIARSVRIPRPGRRPLAGHLHAAGAPVGTVLVIHGFKGFKDWGFFPHLCDELARAGLTALRFNLGGCGILEDGDFFDDVEGFETNTYGCELDDTMAAVGWLRSETKGLPLGLLGHSRGGGIAILIAGEDPTLRALVTWSAISHPHRFGPESIAAWERGETVPIVNTRTGQVFRLRRAIVDELRADARRFDIAAHAGRVSAPWLIVHGEQDETVPAHEARALLESSAGGVHETRLLLVPDAGHTFGAVHPFAGETEPLRLAVRESVAWCRRALGPLDTHAKPPIA